MMNLLISKVISSVIQIILFSIIPLIWWLVTARKEVNFFQWIGLKKIDNAKENKTLLWMIAVMVEFAIFSLAMLALVKNVETATSDFTGLGAAAIPAVLVYAIFNTAFPEEIIFRGFLLKRIQNKLGFQAANIIQAVIFGLMHGVMFFMYTGPVKAILIILFTGSIGWAMGFVNEKKAGGSIIPSWTIHAFANILSGLCAAFAIIG